ncbi:hypothetical protein LCGC14_1931900 [marine sediment metagenome]|uniref:Uncharacterized protein n=2 Tax=root TaxID=1 RepID=A0A0F9I1L3_9ZZZZ|nr:MAG: hypothetical protein LCMAC202_00800 [Marseillevirus LCMAC202]
MSEPTCVCEKEELVLKGNCARKECFNKWTETLRDKTAIKYQCFVHCPRICGPGSSVCQECADQGYSAESGTGNGTTYIRKDGKLVDEFPSFGH